MLSSWNDAATPCLGRCRGCPVKSRGEILPQRTAGGIAGRQHAVKSMLGGTCRLFSVPISLSLGWRFELGAGFVGPVGIFQQAFLQIPHVLHSVKKK